MRRDSASETDFNVQDELAETAVPEPPYYDRIDDDWGDFDAYDYWMDIEYNTDEYFDCPVGAIGEMNVAHAGQKRRRTNGDEAGLGKRRKMSSIRAMAAQRRDPPPIVPVLWLSSAETNTLEESTPRLREKVAGYALFGDWRIRFMDVPGFYTANMIRSKELEEPEQGDEEMDDDVEHDDDEGNSDDEDADEESDGVDSALLMEAIKARLTDSGLGGAEQEKFMQAIMGMMAEGEGGHVEDMLEELTDGLLNQVSEEGAGSGAAQWLVQQGVALNEDGEEDEEGQEGPSDDKVQETAQQDTAKGPTPRDSAGVSQSEREVEMGSQAQDPATQVDEQVLQDLETARELLEAPEADTESRVVEAATVTSTQQELVQTPKGASRPATNKRATRGESNTPKKEASGQATTNGKTETTKASTKTGKTPPAKASTQTRKRKASAEEPAPASDKSKRQQRSFAAPTASSQSKAAEAPKRATRSTRQSKK